MPTTKQPSRPKVVARRLVTLARFADDEHAASTPSGLRAPLSTAAFVRLSPAERLDLLRANVAGEVDRERERLAKQHRAELLAREAAAPGAVRSASASAAASATATATTTTTSATRSDHAAESVARWSVSCSCGCGAMLPAPGPRPVLRRHDGSRPRGR